MNRGRNDRESNDELKAGMTHLSLFTGIGGLDLAAEWAGFQTVGQCEWADYPTKVLEKHWPEVPRWRDIRTLTKESFYERTGLRTVDIISGGFPCQPFSVAGKQKGKEDDRYLWPEMFRVIRDLVPRWVVGENVPGIIKIAGGRVVQDLEQEGYHVVVFNFEAAAVGAPHRRERVAFVGYRNADTLENAGCSRLSEQSVLSKFERGAKSERTSETLANAVRIGSETRVADSERREKRDATEPVYSCNAGRNGKNVPNTNGEVWSVSVQTRRRSPGSCNTDWWTIEPDVGRVAHGVPNRVDRLKCLGNAVVPQQFYPIFKAIAEVENESDF